MHKESNAIKEIVPYFGAKTVYNKKCPCEAGNPQRREQTGWSPLMNNHTNSPQALYRFWDKNKNLLYIGISSNFVGRLKAHNYAAEWFGQTANVTIEHYDNRKDVERAEKQAIQTELPQYNKTHNPNYESHVQHWRKLKQDIKHFPQPDQHRLLFSLVDEYRDTHTHAESLVLSLKEIKYYWGGVECELCQAIESNRQYAKFGKAYFLKVYKELREDI